VIIGSHPLNLRIGFEKGKKLRHQHERHHADRQDYLTTQVHWFMELEASTEGSSESRADLSSLLPELSRYLWKLASPRPSLAFHQLHNNSQPLSFNNSLQLASRIPNTREAMR
jgi:hypothetical protein